MIFNKGSSWLLEEFSLLALYEMYENSMENMHTDDRV